MDERDAARQELIRATVALGYPEEFGVVMAGELRGPQSMRRMAAYLRNAHPRSPEEIVDEMLAIIQLRESWVRKKQAEEANAKYWQMYHDHFGQEE